jgi:hypothetical protein
MGGCSKSNASCYCVTGDNKVGACAAIALSCGSFPTCNVDADCAAGSVCTRDTCCALAGGKGVCASVTVCANPARMFARGAVGELNGVGKF